MTLEDEIRALMEARGAAVRARDVDALMASVAPGVESFDVVNPLRYVGAAETRRRAEEWFASFTGPIGYALKDVVVAASGDVAFCHCLTHVSGRTAGGEVDMWLRSTTCLRRIAGRWLVTHQHNSVPFDPANGQAALGLEP